MASPSPGLKLIGRLSNYFSTSSLSSLATGDQGPALKINVGKQPDLEASLFHAERRRRRVVLVSEDIARGEPLAPSRDKNTNSGRGGRAVGESSSNVQKPLQVKQEPAAEEELDNTGGRLGGATLPPAATNNQHLEDETSQDQASGELKNKCEKCFKGFPSLTLLRYHYCSHFRCIFFSLDFFKYFVVFSG